MLILYQDIGKDICDKNLDAQCRKIVPAWCRIKRNAFCHSMVAACEDFYPLKEYLRSIVLYRKTRENGWSCAMLVNMMKTKFFETHGSTVNTFSLTMPKSDSECATQILKDTYKLDFLTLREDDEEKDLYLSQQKNTPTNEYIKKRKSWIFSRNGKLALGTILCAVTPNTQIRMQRNQKL